MHAFIQDASTVIIVPCDAMLARHMLLKALCY